MTTRKVKLQSENAPEKKSKLSSIHFEHICDDGVLKMQIGRSLAERAADFTRVFPNKQISKTRLRKVYLKNGIKFKKIRNTKILSRS